MSQIFKGRPILSGACQGEALVSHGGFNTLASYQKALILNSKKAECTDQNNPDLYKKIMRSSETDCITAEVSGMFSARAGASPFLNLTSGVCRLTFCGMQSAEE